MIVPRIILIAKLTASAICKKTNLAISNNFTKIHTTDIRLLKILTFLKAYK